MPFLCCMNQYHRTGDEKKTQFYEFNCCIRKSFLGHLFIGISKQCKIFSNPDIFFRNECRIVADSTGS